MPSINFTERDESKNQGIDLYISYLYLTFYFILKYVETLRNYEFWKLEFMNIIFIV